MRNSEGFTLANYTKSFRMRKKQAMKSLRMYGDGLSKLEEISQDILSGFVDHLNQLKGQPFVLEKSMYSAVSNVVTAMV